MNLFDFFRANKKVSTASVAKERLHIIGPDIDVLADHFHQFLLQGRQVIGSDDVHVALENQGSCSILELNITLPDR